MTSYNDLQNRHFEESSESDMSPQKNVFKITSNPGKGGQILRHQKYNQSSESDISSLSEEEEDQNQEQRIKLTQNKKTIEVASQSSSQSEDSSGIDLIQQRIKRLEVDLESKIDKHKLSQQQKDRLPKKEDEGPSKSKKNGLSNPPLPPSQKNPVYVQAPQRQIVHEEHFHQESENKNQLNLLEKQTFISKQTVKSDKIEEHIHSEEVKKSPKKKESKKQISMKNSSVVEKKGPTKSRAKTQNNNAVVLLHKAHRQIDQLQKIIEELRHQNQSLKAQMNKSKKKHSSEDVQKLKNLSSGDLKLQKQIQTLKAIEQLQVKLKKSIAKKMKNRANGNPLDSHK